MATLCSQYHGQDRLHCVLSGLAGTTRVRCSLESQSLSRPYTGPVSPCSEFAADSDFDGASPGAMQQQRPPVFPAGAGTRGHPVFPIGQAPGFAAISHLSSEPTSQPPPVFPAGQGIRPGAHLHRAMHRLLQPMHSQQCSRGCKLYSPSVEALRPGATLPQELCSVPT